MGVMKEHMHEIWSEREAFVSFRCPECSDTVTAWLKIPGDVSEHDDQVPCLSCEDADHWDIVIRQDENGYTAELKGDPKTDVSIEVGYSHYDMDWDEPDPEPGAYGIFCRAIAEWNSNVAELASPQGASSRNRMLFITLYSIMEAYLSDAIVRSALIDVSVQRRLIKLEDLRLHDKTLSLDTVLENPNVVRDMLREVLRRFSFHKLVAVSSIAKIAFGKPILPRDRVDKKMAVVSVQKRHDCVHRNGFTIDGDLHADITKDYLIKLGGIFEDMAQSLDSAISDTMAKRYFENLDETDDLESA